MKKLLLLLMLVISTTAFAQVTTSGISGRIKDASENLLGATVQAVHLPSGSRYGAVTNAEGRYYLQGLRPGGPYEITISYIGYENQVVNNVSLNLGETYPLNATLKSDDVVLGEVVIKGSASINGSRNGAAMSFNQDKLASMPSVSRSITDITRLTPQASVNSNGAISFAGTNNRYNSFQIDGAMNNDVFGLSSNGTNGGQASAQPVSLETIEQIQVSVAPYDVRQSGFTGGGINAITKSGTNEFKGSAYFYGNNQDFIGKTPGQIASGAKREKLSEQSDSQWGFTVGGPIIKNKLFFFANYEKADKSYPTSNNVGDASSPSKVSQESVDRITSAVEKLASEQGIDYSPNFSGKDVYTRSDKAGLKLDYNINDNHKLTARYSFVGAERLNFSRSATVLRSAENAYAFSSQTHSVVAELNSRLDDTKNNELRASYVRVRDSRDPQGKPMPLMQINNVEGATVYLGTDNSSAANRLDQDIFTITDNFNWMIGNHNLTVGTHNELYFFENLFIQNLYGNYRFSSLDDFEKGIINQYSYGQSIESVTGKKDYAPGFGALQLGFYVQDNWNITNNFNLTAGVRMDLPLFLDTPTENSAFNNLGIAQSRGIKTNSKPNATPLWSPRVGFRWDAFGDRSTIVRGGGGIFTGRIPFVWLSNSFSNTGVEFEKYFFSGSGIPSGLGVNLNPDTQKDMLANAAPTSTTEVNVFSEDFKFTQNARFNLAVEQMLPGDIRFTLEGIYTKTLNDIVYENLNYEFNTDGNGKVVTLADKYSDLSFDNRPTFKKVNNNYTHILLLDNTSKGYSYNLSAKLDKSFNFGLDLMASYTYGKSKSVNSGSSSVALSNWQYNEIIGNPNRPELRNSDFNIPHRVVIAASYSKSYAKYFKSTVSLIYTGQSGAPVNFTYNGDINGDGAAGNDLMFIPTDAQIDEMPFAKSGSVEIETQKANLKAYLAQAPYLKDHRGEYYQRNAYNMPFEHHFDFHFAQDFKFKTGNRFHTLQLSFDIMNVGNLINSEWGIENGMSSNAASPIAFRNGTFTYTNKADFNPMYTSDFNSRWKGQVGVKYIF